MDRREKIIQLTELGEEVYKACRKKITDLENEGHGGYRKRRARSGFSHSS